MSRSEPRGDPGTEEARRLQADPQLGLGRPRPCTAPGSDLAEWTQVSVLGCRSNDTVCTLRRGHDVTISIDFNNSAYQFSEVCRNT